MAFKIVRKPLAELHTNDSNPRSIKDFKFQKLIANIQAFPTMLEIRPIVIDKDGTVLGGNMRLRAVQYLGWPDVPTIDASTLTDDEKKAFIVLDNQDFGEWDYEALVVQYEPQKLSDLGFEFLGVDFNQGKEVRGGGEFEGLPEYEAKENPFQLMVQFDTEEERDKFIESNGIAITARNGLTLSCWFPNKERSDNSSVKFEQ